MDKIKCKRCGDMFEHQFNITKDICAKCCYEIDRTLNILHEYDQSHPGFLANILKNINNELVKK